MKKLKSTLEHLPCFQLISAITRIEQGESHVCYRVISNKRVYFVKDKTDHSFSTSALKAQVDVLDEQLPQTIPSTVSAENSPPLSAIEQLSAQAGKFDFSPMVIFQNQQWQVQEYLQGESLTSQNLSINDKLKLCIDLMVCCHQQLIINSDDSVISGIPTLHSQNLVEKLLTKLSVEDQNNAQYYLAHFDKSLPVRSHILCHGDLNFSNVIVTNNKTQKPWLIDYDCATFADPEFDIAMLICINELVDEHIEDRINYCVHYYNNQLENSSLHRVLSPPLVTRYLSFCCLINALWYLSQYASQRYDRLRNKAHIQFKFIDFLKGHHKFDV